MVVQGLKQALVIHPRFFIYGGGELLCLYVCKTLQEEGYHVKLASDTYDIETVQRIYGLGQVMTDCEWIEIPRFKARYHHLLAFQRIFYSAKISRQLDDQHPDIVFSTQSSMYVLPNRPLYHFIYDIVDLFAYPHLPTISTRVFPIGGRGLHWKIYYWGLRRMRGMFLPLPKPREFFALSTGVLKDLKREGHANVNLVYPPCPISSFSPRPKKKRVIQVTRIVPQKRLEIFLEVARRLPEYPFYIIGRDTPILQELNPGYSEKLFENIPENVVYVESPIRDCPELLEESKVYLYTGIEPGIGIALVEGVSAGCIPIAPLDGGGGEVVKAVGVGAMFISLEDAVNQVQLAMDSNVDPSLIAGKAKIFSVEAFQDHVRKLL